MPSTDCAPVPATTIPAHDVPWIWTLFICGGAPASAAALCRLRHLCDQEGSTRVELRVVDVSSDPEPALRAGVRAIPSLVADPLPSAAPPCSALRSGPPGWFRRRLRQLQAENAALRALVEAITSGEADALVVNGGVYLRESGDACYRHLVEQMGEAVATLSSTGVVLYANPRLAELLDHPRQSLLGRTLDAFLPPDQLKIFQRLRAAGPGRTERAALDLVGSDGRGLAVLATLSGLRSAGAATQSLVLTTLAARPAAPVAAEGDVLTLLARRHRHTHRTQPLSLLLCALSEAQLLRYPPGTATGDLLWRAFTERLAQALGPDGLVGNFATGQLLGVTAGVAHIGEATALVERVHATLTLPLDLGGDPVVIDPCVGMALETPGSRLEELLLRAEQALEQARPRNTPRNLAIAIL